MVNDVPSMRISAVSPFFSATSPKPIFAVMRRAGPSPKMRRLPSPAKVMESSPSPVSIRTPEVVAPQVYSRGFPSFSGVRRR